MWRSLVRCISRLVSGRHSRNHPARKGSLTAVEYEAVTLIAFEGREAYARACEQARYCRERGSQEGFRFWSEVAGEVRLRAKGHLHERR